MNSGSRISALDGLRGLAVSAVVVYHAWPSILPGGWIGVSVFFTLSGFLITQIVDRDHELTRASMANFWGRRARRLLPAVIVTVMAVVAVVAAADRNILRDVAEEGLAATFYLHNWWSISETGGYWEIFNSDPRPFAHLWSLSIEEQVYLFWPLLIVIFGLRKALVVGAVVVAVGLTIWWGDADAYFATPFRFTEVFVGAALAYVVKSYSRFKVLGFPALIAATGILWGVFVLGESDPFVTKGALLLIAGAATILTGYSLRETKPNVLMGSAPLAWLGQRSYAIYLFHWPFLELLEVSPFIAVALTLIAAEISHHALEWPIRTARRIKRPLSTLGLASVVSALVLVVVIVVGPRPPSQQQIADAVVTALTETTTTTTTTSVASLEQESSIISTPSEMMASTTSQPEVETQEKIIVKANPKVALIGDSVALRLMPAITSWIETLGGELIQEPSPVCTPLWNDSHHEFFAIQLGIIAELLGPHGEPCRPSILSEVDLVLVFDHGAVFHEHIDIRTGSSLVFPDPNFVELLLESYSTLINDTALSEALLVFFTAPSAWAEDQYPNVQQVTLYNDLISEIEEFNQHVYIVDSAASVEENPDRYPRSDGLHLDLEGQINFVVDQIAPHFSFHD
tara:strand:+ start:288 stop:2171 length:1884 start_codon:yes stop_codon:yes gene_type:complete